VQRHSIDREDDEFGKRANLTCRSCVHFDDDPGHLEAEVPGIMVFGSAYGSSRGHAGLCSALNRFHDPIPARDCPSFEHLSAVDHEHSSTG